MCYSFEFKFDFFRVLELNWVFVNHCVLVAGSYMNRLLRLCRWLYVFLIDFSIPEFVIRVFEFSTRFWIRVFSLNDCLLFLLLRMSRVSFLQSIGTGIVMFGFRLRARRILMPPPPRFSVSGSVGGEAVIEGDRERWERHTRCYGLNSWEKPGQNSCVSRLGSPDSFTGKSPVTAPVLCGWGVVLGRPGCDPVPTRCSTRFRSKNPQSFSLNYVFRI